MSISPKTDPLYVIFEQHLYNFNDSEESREVFAERVVVEYLGYLRKNNLSVPKSLEPFIIEELGEQVKVMLLKTIYGFPTIEDFRKAAPSNRRRQARSRYSKVSGSKAAIAKR